MESRRPVASTVLLFLAFAMPPLFLGFWWLGSLPGHHVPEIGREIFGNLPAVFEAMFYVTVGTFLGLMFFLFAQRAKNWQRGAAEERRGLGRQRLRETWRGLSMQTLLEDRAAGLMHSMIYFGFGVLLLGTITLEIDHLLPSGLKFLEGGFYQGYSFVLDVAALVFIGGLAWAAFRRYLQKPWRLKAKTKPEDALILLVLGLVGISGLLVEAARIATMGRPAFETWSFAGYGLSYLFPEASSSGAHQIVWALHAVSFVAFLVIIPVTKLRHILTSPINMALAPTERPKGAMKVMPNLMEVEDIETIGASRVGEFTWKQLFDTDACTVCGRCTSVCPANTTGKPLDPREIVLKLGEVAALTAADPIAPPVTLDGAITIESDLVFERITAAELWACTTCRACDEICPVDIEIVDKILDMRRYLALMEADFPSELGKAYLNLENSSNIYGMDQQARGDWAEELDFPVKMLGEPGVTAEYLYWVGCAGSFDDRNRKVTMAVARLLHHAGVDFAILGPREQCTGDSARRSGNEYLFQQMALQNIETFQEFGVRKIITQCPHCFNTLANEYPQFGGDYEVVHHAELLFRLVEEGRLVPQGNGQMITYHDPCYLGRHNDTYLAPRNLVAGVGSLAEMPRCGDRSFCCGAGGARMWMEESTGKKVNIERTEEALATGADAIATGCPFCLVMLDDGVRELGREENVVVRDLAVLLAERVLE